MVMIVYSMMMLFVFLVIAKCLIDINKLDKRIDEVIAEEKRQNKRMDVLEKREQVRQSEERRDKAYIEANELFEKW